MQVSSDQRGRLVNTLAAFVLAYLVGGVPAGVAHAQLVPCGVAVTDEPLGSNTRVVLHNDYGTTLRVYLLSASGATWVADIAPGAIHTISAYYGQLFRITDWDGRCRSGLRIRAGVGYVSLS